MFVYYELALKACSDSSETSVAYRYRGQSRESDQSEKKNLYSRTDVTETGELGAFFFLKSLEILGNPKSPILENPNVCFNTVSSVTVVCIIRQPGTRGTDVRCSPEAAQDKQTYRSKVSK